MDSHRSDIIRIGPLAYCCAKIGIGVTAPLGLRPTLGPRGHYLRASTQSVYYRSTLTPSESALLASKTGPGDATQVLSDSGLAAPKGDVVLPFREAPQAHLLGEILKARSRLPAWPWVAVAGIALGFIHPALIAIGAVATIVAAILDRVFSSTVLFLDLDPSTEAAYLRVIESFQALGQTSAIWHVPAGEGEDRRRLKNFVTIGRNPGRVIHTNFDVPSLRLGDATICFFPHEALVLKENTASFISYDELQTKTSSIQQAELGRVPRDAKVIDYTWRHVTKAGGPDPAFASNPQVPVCQYETILISAGRISERIVLSRPGRFAAMRYELLNLPRKVS